MMMKNSANHALITISPSRKRSMPSYRQMTDSNNIDDTGFLCSSVSTSLFTVRAGQRYRIEDKISTSIATNLFSHRCNTMPKCKIRQSFLTTVVLLFTSSAVMAFIPSLVSFPLKSSAFVNFQQMKTSFRYRPSSTTTSHTELFGIKGFRQWFDKEFPDAVKTVDVSKQKETFDHVLVDMNQILHGVLRRSRHEDQGIKLLFIELDRLIQQCQPSQSLVLAIDGSPAAAKLATQRKRRYSILKNTQFKLQHLEKLVHGPTKKQLATRKRNYHSELRSLQLTPGTETMQTLESAILYWAWQRLLSQNKPHSRLLPKVRIYFSSSRVPGEGEIKLLEWVHNFRGHLSKNPGQSIALIGGDADLLLEAMLIPPSWTHNVFILRPADKTIGSSRKNIMHCTTLWQITLSLHEFCCKMIPKEYYNPQQNISDQQLLLQMRHDIVILTILNGNDYLPNLTSCGGFDNLFRTYLKLIVRWIVSHKSVEGAGLIDPNTLTFHLQFCVDFFKEIGVGFNIPTEAERMESLKKVTEYNTLYQNDLNTMASIGFVPSPIEYHYIRRYSDEELYTNYNRNGNDIQGTVSNRSSNVRAAIEIYDGNGRLEDDGYDDDYDFGFDGAGDDNDLDDEFDEEFDIDEDDEEEDNNDDKYGENALNEDGGGPIKQPFVLRLSLGIEGKENYREFEVYPVEPTSTGIRNAKSRLAKMALEDFSLFDIISEKDMATVGYGWEIEHPAACNVERYLAGLLWTLQTYQDGVCPSYSYNYGKRLGPTGALVEKYFEKAIHEGRQVGAQELLNNFPPGGFISAGAACLAALPTSVKNIVPKPYSLIDSETVEAIYGECMDAVDNFFNLKKFEVLANQEVAKLTERLSSKTIEQVNNIAKDGQQGRRIIPGDHYWTVLGQSKDDLEHPFKPPSRPNKDFAHLKSSSRIKASRIICMDCPRPRPGWDSTLWEKPLDNNCNDPYNISDSNSGKVHFRTTWLSKHNVEVDHLDFGSLLSGNHMTIADIPYKTIFEKSMKSSQRKSSPVLPKLQTNLLSNSTFGLLKQLSYVGIIGDFDATVIPATLEFPEQLKITMRRCDFTGLPPKDMSYTRYRNRHERKKMTKHLLASTILDDLIGIVSEKAEIPNKRWYEFAYPDLVTFLLGHACDLLPINVPTNIDNQTALMVLKQLNDLAYVGDYEFHEETAPEEISRDTIITLKISKSGSNCFPSEDLNISYQRREHQPKQQLKHYLAGLVLDNIINKNSQREGLNRLGKNTTAHWYDISFEELKNEMSLYDKI